MRPLTEEGVRQCNRINALHSGIRSEVWINEEEDGHIHGLASIELLLLKAKALNLAEIRCNLAGSHTVCRNSDDIVRAFVGCGVKCECSLARQHPDFTLLRSELPWQNIGDGAVECDAEPAGVGYRSHAGCCVFAAAAVGSDRLATPAGLLTNLVRKNW